MLFGLGRFDEWQIIPCLIGVAGTGKSVLMETVLGFFEQSDISMITATMEQKFGLGFH